MGSSVDLAKLAPAYRWLVLGVGAQILLALAGPVWTLLLGESALGLLVELGRLLLLLVTIVVLAVFAYRTAAALGSSVAVLWAVAMVIPLVNLVTLLVLSSKATAACRAAGIEVGLLGPKLRDRAPTSAQGNPGA